MVMPRRIGLDLDNTVIDYTPAYRALARDMGLPQQLGDRESIRQALRKSEDDDEEWQRFQSHLYTAGLGYAMPAPGLRDFLQLCGLVGVSVVIISHKTKTTPERFGSLDLRAPASEWLSRQGIVPAHVPLAGVFFCENQDAKVRTITNLKCDLFVDDLIEVLHHPDMPYGISRVHYLAGASFIAKTQDSTVDADFFALTTWLRSC